MERGLVACTDIDGLMKTILITFLWTGDSL